MNDLTLPVRTMDSREIAELTQKNHADVCRDIKAQLGQLEGGVSRFADTYRNLQNGQDYPCYKLPYRETMILVSGYRVDLRAKIVDRWMELEKLPQNGVDTRLDRLEGLVERLVEAVATMLPVITQSKQLDYVQDYYSVLGYANKKGIRLTFSEGIALGKRATKLSRETGKEKREVDDERYGRVGSYHIDVLKEIFKQ